MEEVRKVTFKEAGVIQMNAPRFNCKILELAVVTRDTARISVSGTPEDLEKLFAYVAEAVK